MAKFKKGDRVKLIKTRDDGGYSWSCVSKTDIGDIATIKSFLPHFYGRGEDGVAVTFETGHDMRISANLFEVAPQAECNHKYTLMLNEYTCDYCKKVRPM